MKISSFEVGPFLENTYLLSKEGEAILIDPGFSNKAEFEELKKVLKEQNSDLIGIVLTHAHVDHVLGLQLVRKEFDIPVYLDISDLFLWENYGSQAKMFGINQVGFDFTPEALPEDKEFTISGFTFTCLHTPGHSPDHTSIYFKGEGFLIAGDALFRESIGRTDLYKGNFDILEQSIEQKLYKLPENTIVYPGHGPKTTIGHEMNNNPFVKA